MVKKTGRPEVIAKLDEKPKVRDLEEIAKDTTGTVAVVNPYEVRDLRDTTDNITEDLPPEEVDLETAGGEVGQLQFESLDEIMDEDMEPEDLFDDPSEDPFDDLNEDEFEDEEDDDDSYF